MLLDEGVRTPVTTFGLPDDFLGHGTREELLIELSLTPPQIAHRLVMSRGDG
jgi:1-deoxy-D-xylulose-5-phosphate synthase